MASLAFVPWVRAGAAAAIGDPDTLGPDQAAAAALPTSLSINGGARLAVPMQLRGPADVVGIDPGQIVRWQPPPGTATFEPNHLAYVDFDRPDLPWLFTPAAATAEGRLRPWLCLVVVRVGDGVSLQGPGDGPLPVLRISAPARLQDELPGLLDSWAWAHAQVAGGAADSSTVHAAMNGPADVSLSRIVSPRLLAPDTAYLACLVPTFDIGRRAGLGETITDDDLTAAHALAPAWSLAASGTAAPATTVELPVYSSWTFSTGDDGDFAALVRKLRIQPAPAGLGIRPIDISRPGFAISPTVPAGSSVLLEGALAPLNVPDAVVSWTGPAADGFVPALADIVNAAATAAGPDPLLAPPLYGRWHAARVTATPGGPAWFDQLNLDPRYRAAAALGTRVVQDHAEALMASAWEQAAAIEAANQRVRQLQLSLAVNTSLHTRTITALAQDAAIRVAAPVFGRIHVAASAAPTTGGGVVTPPTGTVGTGGRTGTVGHAGPVGTTAGHAGTIGRADTTISRSGAGTATSTAAATSASSTRTAVAALAGVAGPLEAASPAMRRIGRDRGPISRRARSQGITRAASASVVARLYDGMAALGSATFELMTIRSVLSRLSNVQIPGYAEVTPDTVTDAGPLPNFHVVAEGVPAPIGHPPPGGPTHGADSTSAAAFRAAAVAHLAALNPGRTAIIVDPVRPPTMDSLHSAIVAQLAPRSTMLALAASVLTVGPSTSAPTGTPASEPVGVDVLQTQPSFVQPMYAPLADISSSLLAPGLDAVLDDRVVGLKSNSRFIESYLVGLNDEIGRELVWRGFPTEQRTTYFAQFWDARAAQAPRPDITSIASWVGGLGTHAPTGGVVDPSVLLIRSELFRRYPNATVYAAKAKKTGSTVTVSDDPADEIFPAFSATLPPDLCFFGFDLSAADMIGTDAESGYYLVIQEHAGEPIFGLDADTAPTGATHLVATDPILAGLPAAGLHWGRNGAHTAGILRRKPIRIAIRAAQLVSGS